MFVSPRVVASLLFLSGAPLMSAKTGKSEDVTGLVLDVGALTEPPVATKQVPPEYPTHLRKAGTTGEALVEFVVTASGDVAQSFVVRATHPEFGEEALRAIRRWKYAPGQVNGQPVNTRLQQPMSFSLADDGALAHTALLVDRANFVSLLPAKIYVSVRPMGKVEEDFNSLKTALERLGRTQTSFIKLPKDAKPLRAIKKIPPNYPRELRDNHIEGGASFLILLGDDGAVKAICSTAATDPLFAISGSVAVAQWKLVPPQVDGKAVPVVFEQTMMFALQ